MKLPYTKVKFYPEVKSQTGLSSLRVSCKRDRTQYATILIHNERSEIQAIRYGVMQGSIVGALLFIIYINDLN